MLCPPPDCPGKSVIFLLVALLWLPIHVSIAQDITQEFCSNGLTEAQNQLFMGGFNRAITLLEPCISEKAYDSQDNLVKAHELLANVYIAINDDTRAGEIIGDLLEIVPNYTPNPDRSTSDFVFLVEQIRTQVMPTTPSISAVRTDDLFNEFSWIVEDSSSVGSFFIYRGFHPDSLTFFTSLKRSDLSFISLDNNSLQGSYRDLDVSYSTTYYYAIEAVNENEMRSSQSAVVEITTADAPSIPLVENAPRSNSGRKLSPWIFVGGGAVAGGLAILLAGGGGNGGGEPVDRTLPEPPPLLP